MSIALIRPKTLCAWKGPSLLIVNTRGDCGDDEPLAGYYFRETRFLRTLRRSEEHTSELQSRRDLVCRLLLEKKKGQRQRWRKRGSGAARWQASRDVSTRT